MNGDVGMHHAKNSEQIQSRILQSCVTPLSEYIYICYDIISEVLG